MSDLSIYQQAILNWLVNNAGTGRHLIGSGVAGCGKTYTAMKLFEVGISLQQSGCYVAFNKDIREAVIPKLPKGTSSETYHSHGFRAIRNSFGGARMDENKLLNFLKQYPQLVYLKYKIKKLVSLCKINGILSPDDETLYRLSIEFDIDFDDTDGKPNERQMRTAFDFTRKAINYSLDNCTVVDFDDMLFIPYAMPNEISMPQYDLLIIDELQDTSPVQMALALRSVNPGGNIIGIGDRKQAIYAFRGAGATSVDDFKTGTNADELPLSICYRCPTEVRDLVNRRFPEIKFETPEWAKQGQVLRMKQNKAIEAMIPGDLILCRVNKYLVEGAFEAIRAGKRAQVKGRAIGKGITALIKKSNAGTTKEFLDWLDAWRDREIEKAERIESEDKRQAVIDQFETILVIADGTLAVDELAARCDALFDDDPRNCIVFSSVHKAKGLEANNVYISHPELMPHPAAWKPIDIKQERNIEYVAVTRAMENLIFIDEGKEEKKLPEQTKALPEPFINTEAVEISPLPFRF